MRARRQPLRKAERARGFSIIELVVVVFMLALLWAIAAPAVQNARAAARRAQCLNNIRTLGMAAQTFSEHHNGSLPGLFDVGRPINWGTRAQPLFGPSPWTVQLLPTLEQGALAEKVRESANDPSLPAETNLASLGSAHVPVFNCPDDPNENVGGNLTYAINAGYIGDLWYGKDTIYTWSEPPHNRPGGPWSRHSSVNYYYRIQGTENDQHEVARATGVAWPDCQIDFSHITNSDGVTNTLLFAENLQSQRWVGRLPVIFLRQILERTDPQPEPKWLVDLEYSDFAFGLPVAINPSSVNEIFNKPFVAEVIDQKENPFAGVAVAGADKSQALVFSNNFTSSLTGTILDGRINWNQHVAPEGEAPRPSSMHLGGVNVVYVGGNGKFLSQDIDVRLYARLLTWAGYRHGQQVISEAGF